MDRPCTSKACVGHVALGVEVAMPHPAGRDAVDQLDAADLDDAMAVERIEPGRLGIEHDLAQRSFPCSR